MKIVLEENDSFIQPDGKATMIVVAVTRDDGKVVRFPYSADRSMSALIDDVNLKIGNATISEVRTVQQENLSKGLQEVHKAGADAIRELAGMSDGKIRKEDLVKCIKLLPRDKDAPKDLEIGGIYRVLALPIPGKVPHYEVIDDTDFHKAEIPRRVAAYPEEIEYFQKRKTPIPFEKGRFEEIFNCPSCQKRIVCHRMDDNKFHGKCEDCDLPFTSDDVREKVETVTP